MQGNLFPSPHITDTAFTFSFPHDAIHVFHIFNNLSLECQHSGNWNRAPSHNANMAAPAKTAKLPSEARRSVAAPVYEAEAEAEVALEVPVWEVLVA